MHWEIFKLHIRVKFSCTKLCNTILKNYSKLFFIEACNIKTVFVVQVTNLIDMYSKRFIQHYHSLGKYNLRNFKLVVIFYLLFAKSMCFERSLPFFIHFRLSDDKDFQIKVSQYGNEQK